MLRVTPIYGSSLVSPPSLAAVSSAAISGDDSDDPPEWLSSPLPSCTLVEYAGTKLLLNVGWDESLPSNGGIGGDNAAVADDDSGNIVAARRKGVIVPDELPDADAVLVCDSTLSSLGGLPLFFGASSAVNRGRAPRSLSSAAAADGDGDCVPDENRRRRRNPPFLATYPTVKMGQMTLYDRHASLSLDGVHPGYALEDVDAVFGPKSFHTLKYSQTVYLPMEGEEDGWVGEEGEEHESGDAAITKSSDNQQLKNNKTSNKLLAITPQLSGHVVGGCYWVLRQLSDDTEVVLAPTYHHAKERHLAGSTLHKFGVNADALLTMPGGPRGLLGRLYHPPPKNGRQSKYSQIIKYNKGNKPILSPPLVHRSESELIESVMTTLRRDGNVLIPVDASGRVLELLLVLDRHWEKQRLADAYNLAWVGPMSVNTIEFARSQLEWMAEPLGAQFDSQRGHPYAMKSVQICSSVGEVEGAIERSNGNPACVLASGASFDHGPARDLLLRWGGNPDNLVLITDSTQCVPRGDIWFGRRSGGGSDEPVAKEEAGPIVAAEEAAEAEESEGGSLLGPALPPSAVSPSTTSSQLLYAWCAAKASRTEMADEVSVDVYVPRRAPLSGEELRRFLAEEEEQRRRRRVEAERKAMMEEIELARGRLRLGDDGDGAGLGGAGKAVGATTSGLKSMSGKKGPGGAPGARPRKRSRFDQNLFIKFSKPVHMMFDVREEAVGIGQPDSVARHGIGESVGRAGDVLEDDYGIAVRSESFVDIVTGVDPTRFAGRSGRIGEEVMRRGLGFGADGRPVSDTDSAEKGGDTTDDIDRPDVGVDEKMLEVADLSSGRGIIKGRNGRPPVKVSVVPRRLEVLAEVTYVPLEGRVDARAARQSVRSLQPRYLLTIGGPRMGALSLAEALRVVVDDGCGGGGRRPAHAPADGETVKLAVGHAAYGVRLVDTPYLTPKEREEIELAGNVITEQPTELLREAKIGDCTASLVDLVATGKRWAMDGSIVLAPHRKKQESLASLLKKPSLMLSTREVLLTDLRAEVAALGMKAEYGALSGYSQLIVNGKIFVRKDNSTGKLDVEGPLCEDFYKVRSVVCGQYVTIS